MCRAPEYFTEYNKKLNQDVYNTCKVNPKFNPQLGCRGCMYLEQEIDGTKTTT